MEFDNKLCVQNVHSIVKQMLPQRSREAMDDDTVSGSMHTALSLGDELWGLQNVEWQITTKENICVRAEATAPSSTAAPKGQPRKPQGRVKIHAYEGFSMSKHDAWFKKFLDPKVTEKVPNAQQLVFCGLSLGVASKSTVTCRKSCG